MVEMVYCAYCNAKMYPQTPLSGRKSEKRRILSYRCDNKFCMRKNKELRLSQSVRAIVIFKFMYEMLEGLEVNREDYEKLRKRLETANKARLQSDAIKIHSLQGAYKNNERDIKERSLNIIALDKKSPVYRSNESYK